MSRQYDDFIDSHFEYNGETHALIEPSSPEELAEAFKNCDLLQDGIARGVVEFQGYLAQQEEYIHGYMHDLGDYDNTLLVKNISFLLKKTGLRIGDLESAIGLSTGYISRTSKPGAGRKMSIDSVWKIARLFSTEMQELVEKDMEEPTYNTALVLRFIGKLIAQATDEDIRWRSGGDDVFGFRQYLYDTGVFSEIDENQVRYLPKDHLNDVVVFTVADYILVCEDIRPGWFLAVIPYTTKCPGYETHYDFVFYRFVKDTGSEDAITCEMEKCFYSSDDTTGEVTKMADKLYNLIKTKECDTSLNKGVKSWMIDYLS